MFALFLVGCQPTCKKCFNEPKDGIYTTGVNCGTEIST